MKKYLVIALGVMLLTGWTSCTSNQTKDIEVACTARATAISALAIANDQGKLSKVDQSRVTTAIAATKDICAGNTPPTLDQAAMQAFQNGITVLQGEQAAIQTPVAAPAAASSTH